MIHRPFLRSAIQVVGDFRIGDFDLQSSVLPEPKSSCLPFLRGDLCLVQLALKGI